MSFGKPKRDYNHRSRDNKHMLAAWRGLSPEISIRDLAGEQCTVLKILGPVGSNPDNIHENERPKVCSVMKDLHQAFEEVNFPNKERVWIFKLAETANFAPLFNRIYGDRFRFIFGIRNPLCHKTRHYNSNFKEIFPCYHPLKDNIYNNLKVIDSRISDLSHQGPNWFSTAPNVTQWLVERMVDASTTMEQALKRFKRIENMRGNRVEIYNFVESRLADKDFLFAMIWREIVIHVSNFLREEMAGRFEIIRHEDLLTEKGLQEFARNVKKLLSNTTIFECEPEKLRSVAANFASHSRGCSQRVLPTLARKYLKGPFEQFDYALF